MFVLCVAFVLMPTGSALAAVLEVRVPATDSSTEPWLEGVSDAQDIELTSFPEGNFSLKRAKELARALEGRSLKTLRLRRLGGTPEAMTTLASAPGLGRVSALQLEESSLDVDTFAALCAGRFGAVRFVKLDDAQLRDDHLAVLAQSKTFSKVEWLSLVRNQFGAAGVKAISNSGNLASLQTLRLDENPLGLEGVVALSQANLPKLTALHLQSGGLDDQALNALVTAPIAKQLLTLDVRGNEFTRDGVGAVASSGQVFLTVTPKMELEFRSAWDAGSIRAGGVGEELSGDVVAAYSEDLDALQGVRVIEGSLTITGKVDRLSALLNLEKVGGSLVIRGTARLRTLDGLGALKTVGGNLEVSGNRALGSVSGLSALESVGGDFLLPGGSSEANPKLKTVKGPATLVRVLGSLVLGAGSEGKSALKKVSGFDALDSIGGDFTLSGLGRLNGVAGFGALGEIGGSMVVEDSPRLKKFSGLKSLSTIGGDLRLCYPKRGLRAAKSLVRKLSKVTINGETVTDCPAK
ncbi:MAG: hypothetical protein AAFQ82_01220 [Myxococcota bacterium]